MKKSQFIITLAVSAVVVLGILSVRYYFAAPYVGNYRDITFTIDGTPARLTDPGIKYFGNEAVGDLNGDQQADVVFLFTSEPGGSGTFFYAVAALGSINNGFTGTNAFLIGDRIAPQTTEINSSTLHGVYSAEIYVNYAERRKGEPFTNQPSQGATLFLKVTPEGVLEGLMK